VLVVDDVVIYSASDLAAAARCEYALLRAFDAKLGRGPAVVVEDDLLARTAKLGNEHEHRRLEQLRRQFGGDVTVIGRPAFTVGGLNAAAAATMRAVDAGAPVVYQAAMFDGRFVGFADFLVLDPVPEGGRYRVGDTKLARSAKITALLQLAAYSDTLAHAGVPVADEAELELGDGAVLRYRVDELIPVYRRQRDRLQTLLDTHLASGAPVDWADDNVQACMRCPACEPNVRAADDLLLVAGMRVSQRALLHEAGIHTVAELAASTGSITGMAASTAASLAAQARIQVLQRETGEPQYEVTDPDALGALPKPDDGDLFFDFEGDPLWTTDGATWGLEYLFGVLDATGAFKPLWAHDRRSERKAFIDFLKLVRKRRKRYPAMHIYHYAAYEKSALLRLASRYGIGEDEVDDLLRGEILVDLFPVVRNGIRVGAESYSLKALESMYMGADLRSGEVTNAADSITQYARYCSLRDEGRDEEAAVALKEIEDYNRYDCRSTRLLRDWLLLRAFEHGVTHLTRPVPPGEPVPPDDQTAQVLTTFAGDAGVTARSQEQSCAALLNAARGYFQRERKPYWWSHFQRLNHPVDEWADLSGVFLVDTARVVADWHLPPRKRKARRHIRLTGVLQGGLLDNRVQLLYDRPAPPGLDDAHPDRRAAGDATVLEMVEADGVPVEVSVEELQPDAGPFTQLPMALTPGKPLKTDRLEAAIEAVAVEAAATLSQSPPHLPRTAVVDILCRRPPVTRSGNALSRQTDDVGAITAALLDLDRSYLAVHGPPGTGKTYTAAHVIARLVNQHRWRVGIVAQSHAVVAHLLDEIVDAGVDTAVVAKKTGNDVSTPTRWQVIPDNQYAAFVATNSGCVIGGTAWDFANETRVPPGSLDLLTIDEAGQFSLGYTIGVSRSAHNLLLLGDPQQLGQVCTGSHSEPVDHSALGWLMEGKDVLPAEFGYFLEFSHRMHPAVCQPVSTLSYDNRLRSHPKAADRVLAGHTPGVRTLFVDHENNSTTSAEEAAAIAAEIGHLIGTPWTDEYGPRLLTARDVLVVTAYNSQVLKVRSQLCEAGLDDVLVGTVDKLQGRQAPVVFVSMTASTIDDVPRGISFLLNRNRLNVAISRAQYLTVIVRSPMLTEYLPGTPNGLVDLGAFLTLTPCDTPAQ
jgi:predicted RecB family nuclease